MKQTTAKSMYILLLFLIPVFSIVFTSTPARAAPVSTDASPIYLVSGDLIKNFKVESIGTEGIDPGGSAYDNRLKFEVEPQWKMDQNSITLVYSHKVGNKVYFYYKLALRTKMNIYTNVRLEDATETIERDSKSYRAASYDHYDINHDRIPGDSWDKDITFNHYSFWESSSLREYNSRNRFGGTIALSFDIDDNPLPDSLVDSSGNKLNKEFNYIGVSSASVINSEHGYLSEAPPDIRYSVADYETDERADYSGDNPSPGPMAPKSPYYAQGYKENYDFDTQASITDAGYDTYDPGLQAQSPGSSLNPTRKDGGPIFDNTMEQEQSQKNCKLYYNLGSLSPVVTEYYARLSWTEHEVTCREALGWTQKWIYEKSQQSKVKSSALHVNNRYFQNDFQVVFNIWTAYEIQVLDTPASEDYDMEKSVEYYDNVTWQASQEGFIDGEYHEETSTVFDDLLDNVFPENNIAQEAQTIIILIIILIVAVAAVVIVIRFIKPRRKIYYDTRIVR